MAEDLVPVFNATDEVQSLLYCTMLQEAGIDVIERPLEESWLEGVMQQGLHSQLLVRAEDAERAHALVESFRAEADQGLLNATPDEDPKLAPTDEATGNDEA
ncbi:MAG TPA: hypothetical protein VGL77_14475 [Armatimonadota bacterium]|jgi:hypothetical protein